MTTTTIQKDTQRPQMSVVRMVTSLGVVTLAAALILSLTYIVTAGPIAESEMNGKIEALKAVAPEFDNNPVADTVSVAVEAGQPPVLLYPARKGGELVGAAVETYSLNGFSGLIKVMVGFDADGNIFDYRVLQHAETPGLGAKMEEWFRSPEGSRSVLGVSPDSVHLYVSKDPDGKVDGITAATISSRAFLESVRRAFDAYKQYKNECSNKENPSQS